MAAPMQFQVLQTSGRISRASHSCCTPEQLLGAAKPVWVYSRWGLGPASTGPAWAPLTKTLSPAGLQTAPVTSQKGGNSSYVLFTGVIL